MTALTTLSDEELLDLVRSGDSAAFSQVYERYKGLLYIFAFKLVKDEDDAADFVQEIFISLWDKRENLNLRGSVSAYLYAAVRYKFFNRLDHQKVREAYQASFDLFTAKRTCITDDQVRERELARLVEQEIANLPKKMREVFEMSRNTTLSQKEIAEVLQISDQTVKKQVRNAVKLLRVKFGALFTFLLSLISADMGGLETAVKIIFKKL